MARWLLRAIVSIVQGARGRNSFVIALNRADGKEVWSKALGPLKRGCGRPGTGPRGTPTVDGDRLYVLTENGDLACLKTDGVVVWQLQHPEGIRRLAAAMADQRVAAGGRTASSSSLPGGPGAGMVKLDKMTGKTVWTSKDLSDTAGIFVDHRRGRAGRAYVHDLHRVRRRWRARVRRQADVPLCERREQDRECRDARLLE